MKIKKSTLQPAAAAKEVKKVPVKASKYDEAKKHISKAIEALTDVASDKQDIIATDSIANLSVVLLDLEGGK